MEFCEDPSLTGKICKRIPNGHRYDNESPEQRGIIQNAEFAMRYSFTGHAEALFDGKKVPLLNYVMNVEINLP